MRIEDCKVDMVVVDRRDGERCKIAAIGRTTVLAYSGKGEWALSPDNLEPAPVHEFKVGDWVQTATASGPIRLTKCTHNPFLYSYWYGVTAGGDESGGWLPSSLTPIPAPRFEVGDWVNLRLEGSPHRINDRRYHDGEWQYHSPGLYRGEWIGIGPAFDKCDPPATEPRVLKPIEAGDMIEAKVYSGVDGSLSWTWTKALVSMVYPDGDLLVGRCLYTAKTEGKDWRRPEDEVKT